MNECQILDFRLASSSNSSFTAPSNVEARKDSSVLLRSQNMKHSKIYAIKEAPLQTISAFAAFSYLVGSRIGVAK